MTDLPLDRALLRVGETDLGLANAAREELAMLRGYLTRRRATLKEEGHDPIAADGCDACKEMADIDTALGESAPTRAGEERA